jgi:hypothetical protein
MHKLCFDAPSAYYLSGQSCTKPANTNSAARQCSKPPLTSAPTMRLLFSLWIVCFNSCRNRCATSLSILLEIAATEPAQCEVFETKCNRHHRTVTLKYLETPSSSLQNAQLRQRTQCQRRLQLALKPAQRGTQKVLCIFTVTKHEPGGYSCNRKYSSILPEREPYDIQEHQGKECEHGALQKHLCVKLHNL